MTRDLEPIEDPEPEEVSEYKIYSSSSGFGLPFKAKLIFWSTLVGGIAVGTFLFLFFVSVFLYVFLPVTAVLLLYHFLRRLMR